MTTIKTLGICPRCAYDQYAEYREDAWAEYRGGFLAGFLVMAGFSVAILAVLLGVLG